MHNAMHNGNMSYITGFKKGNETAFSYYYNLFYTPVLFFARKITGDPAAAEDIVADTFMKLWQKHQDFDSEAYIKNFLYIATKNACLNFLEHLRQVKKTMKLAADPVLQEDFALNQIIRAELSWSIYNAVERLPTQYRQIFKMSFLEDMKNQEIANKLGLSIKTVKNQKAKAILLLRKMLTDGHLATWILLFSYFSDMSDH